MTNDGGVWVKLEDAGGGGLEGLGGWATVKSTSGTVTRLPNFTLNDVEWAAWEFTDDGSIEIEEPGFVEVVLVAAGGGTSTQSNYCSAGGAGGVLETLVYLDAVDNPIQVGDPVSGGERVDMLAHTTLGDVSAIGGPSGSGSNSSAIYGSGGGSSGGSNCAASNVRMWCIPGQGHLGWHKQATGAPSPGGGAGGPATATVGGPAREINFTGTPRSFGRGGYRGTRPAEQYPGDGGIYSTGGAGEPGVALIRVPIGNAPSVRETYFEWSRLVKVENGVVTERVKVPKDDASVFGLEWVPAPRWVSVGCLQTGEGEFVIPVTENLVVEEGEA